MSQYKRIRQKFHSKAHPVVIPTTTPAFLFREIALKFRSRARMDLVFLNAIIRLKHFYPEAQVVDVNGRQVSVAADEVFVSVETIAEDFYCMLTGRRTVELYCRGVRVPAFESLYRRLLRSRERLTKYVKRVRYANGTDGIEGSIWKIVDPRLIEAAKTIHITNNPLESAELAVAKALVEAEPHRFVYSEACVSIYDRGRYMNRQQWEEVVAKHRPDEARHTSVGAFDKKRPTERDPCMIPWVIIEAEKPGADIFDNLRATRKILQALDLDGVPLSEIDVVFSGNKSFHIRIPSGMFGNPIFKNSSTAKNLLWRWAYKYIDEWVDTNLFDPRHLVRMVGSTHHSGGKCISWSACYFMSRYNIILQDIPKERGTNTPKKCPLDVKPNVLKDQLESVMGFFIPEMDDIPEYTSGAYLRALEGCEEGEYWHDRHIGRNKLIFIAACYLLKNYNPRDAWQKVLEVNNRNSPPLNERSVKRCFDSALRSIRKYHDQRN